MTDWGSLDDANKQDGHYSRKVNEHARKEQLCWKLHGEVVEYLETKDDNQHIRFILKSTEYVAKAASRQDPDYEELSAILALASMMVLNTRDGFSEKLIELAEILVDMPESHSDLHEQNELRHGG